RNLLQGLETDRGGAAAQRVRRVHCLGADMPMRLMAPLGKILCQPAHDLVSLRQVNVIERNADLELANLLDAVVRFVLLRRMTGEVNDFSRRQMFCRGYWLIRNWRDLFRLFAQHEVADRNDV